MDEKDEHAAMMAVLDDMQSAAMDAKKSKYAPKPKMMEEAPETPAEEAEEPSQEMEVSPAELEALLNC